MTTESEELEINFQDFDKICRFCFKRSNYLMSIFEEIDEKPDTDLTSSFIGTVDTVALLDMNLGLKVHFGDGLPECICNKCYEQLVISNQFRKLCHYATNRLNKIRLAHEEEQKLLINEQTSPFECNDVSSSCEDMFTSEPNVSVAPEEPTAMIDHEKPETTEPVLTDRIAIMLRAKALKKMKRKKRGRKPKPKVEPNPKVEPKPKLKEKKQRDKKELKELKEKRKQVCPVCGMLVSFLPYHLEIHDPNIFYDCDICGHRAPSRNVIITHFKNKHFSKREHTCPQCALTFTQARSLKRHLTIHSGEKNFKCECGKAYRLIDSLKTHRKRHLEPKIPCPHCGKKFYTKNELESHVGIHTGEKNFKCDICPAAFVASSSLAAHRRQHKKDNILPSCKLCGLQFTDRLLLTMHMHDHKHKRWFNAPDVNLEM